ncbi:unnamed protein product, partial [Rotaria sp. Silwood2]
EYSTFTATMVKSTDQKAVELVIRNIVSITCYITFACPFFVFLASSKTFREDAKMLFLCQKINLWRPNQIQPHSITAAGNIQSTSMRTHQMPSYFTTMVNHIKPITINEE